ncbi:MAG TPA: hypothetical protein VF276_05825, partial [Chloroflexia bacterium]
FLELPVGEERKAQVPAREGRLAATATFARDVLLRLDDNLRRAPALGVPDIPTPDLVRQARRTLRPAGEPLPLPPESLQRRAPRLGALDTPALAPA